MQTQRTQETIAFLVIVDSKASGKGTAKKEVKMCLPNTTMVKEVAHRLCKLLDMDRFNTAISVFAPLRPEPVSETMSLRQIPVKNNGRLMVRISSTRCPTMKESMQFASVNNRNIVELTSPLKDNLYGKDLSPSYLELMTAGDPTKPAMTKQAQAAITAKLVGELLDKKVFPGLSVQAVCENKKCPIYGIPKFMSLGFGRFTIASVLRGNVCTFCPNRDILQRPMRVVEVIFKECSWKMDGYIRKPDGVMVPENYNNQAFAVPNTQKDLFKKIMAKGQWVEESLLVRELVQRSPISLEQEI